MLMAETTSGLRQAKSLRFAGGRGTDGHWAGFLHSAAEKIKEYQLW